MPSRNESGRARHQPLEEVLRTLLPKFFFMRCRPRSLVRTMPTPESCLPETSPVERDISHLKRSFEHEIRTSSSCGADSLTNVSDSNVRLETSQHEFGSPRSRSLEDVSRTRGSRSIPSPPHRSGWTTNDTSLVLHFGHGNPSGLHPQPPPADDGRTTFGFHPPLFRITRERSAFERTMGPISSLTASADDSLSPTASPRDPSASLDSYRPLRSCQTLSVLWIPGAYSQLHCRRATCRRTPCRKPKASDHSAPRPSVVRHALTRPESPVRASAESAAWKRASPSPPATALFQ